MLSASSRSRRWQTKARTELIQSLSLIWRDLKTILKFLRAHGLKLWYHVILISVLAVLPTLSGLLAPITAPYQIENCDPGGNFNLYRVYKPWSITHIFQITIGFGSLSFSNAKIIDVVWDVVIGRGGQAILALITTIVYTKSLTRLLEDIECSVSYSTFRAVVFSDTSFTSIWRLCSDAPSKLTRRAQWTMTWMVIASAYVISFPTWASAMTGYTSNVSPYLQTRQGTQVPWVTRRAIYTIHDADRVNFTKGYVVGSEGYGFDYDDDDGNSDYLNCVDAVGYDSDSPTGLCGFASTVSKYVAKYGWREIRHVNSTFGGKQLPPPTLHIEAYNTTVYVGDSYYYYQGFDPNHPGTFSSGAVPVTSPPMYFVGGELYSETYVLNDNHSICNNEPSYKWGFSFLLLFILLILSTVWSFGMWIMWLDTFGNSRLDRGPRTLGFFRGVMDMGIAMQGDMGQVPTEEASEADLKALLRQKKNGGRIRYNALDRNKLPLSRWEEFRKSCKALQTLNGWTLPWKLHHWLWVTMVFLSGLVFSPFTRSGVNVFWYFFAVLLLIGLVSTGHRQYRKRQWF